MRTTIKKRTWRCRKKLNIGGSVLGNCVFHIVISTTVFLLLSDNSMQFIKYLDLKLYKNRHELYIKNQHFAAKWFERAI